MKRHVLIRTVTRVTIITWKLVWEDEAEPAVSGSATGLAEAEAPADSGKGPAAPRPSTDSQGVEDHE